MAETIDHTGARPRVIRASAIASLITGAVFFIGAGLSSKSGELSGLGWLIGFGMVAILWIPVATIGTVVTAVILTLLPSGPLLRVQLVAFGAIAAIGALLGGSETAGEVLALTALGLIYGAASTLTYQRYSKANPNDG